MSNLSLPTPVRDAARASVERVATLAAGVCAVPAPTGLEHERARFVADQLAAMGYSPDIDEIGNVSVRRGIRGGQALLILAHTDTVFPEGTDITVRREGDWLHGPGIGDNSTSVAGVLTALALLDTHAVETDADLIAVFNVGEEGLGNLRGAHAALDRFGAETAAVLAVDGWYGNLTHAGVGSVRWRVTVSGPGGHSYNHFGRPSAIHGLGGIIAGLAGMTVPATPRTTFNVGVIDGGVSVNTIAAEASAIVDLRSEDPNALATLVQHATSIVRDAPGDGLTATITVLGERPAGMRDRDDPLVALVADSLRSLGREPEYQAASTDANVPISRGIPAVCTGMYRGEDGHTLRERIFVPSLGDGMVHLLQALIGASALVAVRR